MAPSVPRTIEEALGERVVLQGTHMQGARVPEGRVFRGRARSMATGRKPKSRSVDTERFFRVVDRAVLEAHTKASELPLILAALPEYHSVFRAVSHNPWLLEDGIQKHPSAMRADELRDAAWRLMEPRYHKRLQAAARRLSRGTGARARDRRSHACARVRNRRSCRDAAGRGGPAHTGHVDGRMPRFADRDDPAAGDILDDLAERVLKTGGQVIAAPRASMPTDKGLAAVFRY